MQHLPLWNSGSFGNRIAIPPTCDDCFYPSSELTSQCTDQCVVVACDGPGHVPCPADGRCDFVCDGAINCADCNGLDTFVSNLVCVS